MKLLYSLIELISSLMNLATLAQFLNWMFNNIELNTILSLNNNTCLNFRIQELIFYQFVVTWVSLLISHQTCSGMFNRQSCAWLVLYCIYNPALLTCCSLAKVSETEPPKRTVFIGGELRKSLPLNSIMYLSTQNKKTLESTTNDSWIHSTTHSGNYNRSTHTRRDK